MGKLTTGQPDPLHTNRVHSGQRLFTPWILDLFDMRCIAPQGPQRTPATCIAATRPELTIGILNSVF